MISVMDRAQHHQAVQRALELGRSANPAALPELVRLLGMPSAEVRRLAASAIGKLSGFGADPAAAVAALAPAALNDPHPQAQQYALKALKTYGAAAAAHLHDLDDLTGNPRAKDYVRMAAASAAEAIRADLRRVAGAAIHTCCKCGRAVAPDEHTRSQQAFQRSYCDVCFDQVFLERRNWETQVELNKTIAAADGTVVQSEGERRIAEALTGLGFIYRYDNRFRILKGYAIRPDFYLPELDVYIEYWGLDTLDYQIGMLEKKKLYQQAGKRLVSLYPKDLRELSLVLAGKLSRYARLTDRGSMPAADAGASAEEAR